MTQIKKPLPESLMKAIKGLAESDATPTEKVEGAVLIAHGYGLFTRHEGSINPTDYAIPEKQWGEIADALTGLKSTNDRVSDPISQVNYALTWMNIGPSGYKPEEDVA